MPNPVTPTPSTPTQRRVLHAFTPLTPRSAHAQELKARIYLQSTFSISISSFCSLLADLTALEYEKSASELSRLNRIESFREDFLVGGLMFAPPPALSLEPETFSDGARTSVGTSTITCSSRSPSPPPSSSRHSASFYSAIERGILAEQTIKAHLKPIPHQNFSSLAKVARKAMRKAMRDPGRAVWVSPGLLRSPSFVEAYEERGWKRPGLRWGNFKVDLIKFVASKPKGGGDVTVKWEVCEVKYSEGRKDVIYANYKVQAIFYHLSLLPILAPIPNLSPSHQVTYLLSREPLSPSYDEHHLNLRTNLAWVEHHLFVLLPTWLESVTSEEWDKTVIKPIPEVTSPILDAPSISFLSKIRPNPPSSPLKSRSGHVESDSDEEDEDFIKALGELAI